MKKKLIELKKPVLYTTDAMFEIIKKLYESMTVKPSKSTELKPHKIV